MSQIIIITGKGGVGKTSVAAAHAVLSAGLRTREAENALNEPATRESFRDRAAGRPDGHACTGTGADETAGKTGTGIDETAGKGTLLVSADMAHNLGDIFQVRAGGQVREIAPGLSLLELDPYLLMREEYPNVNRAVASLAGGGASGAALSQIGDSYMIPGFENLFSLLKIRDLYRSGLYDRIIVDCAPTGETLSLLKLPELLSWYVEKFSPVGRMITRMLTPAAKLLYRMDLPDENSMDELGALFRDLVSLQELLKDPEACRVRLACIPERMVVEETRRAYMYLNLYGYPVDAVFINRVLPENAGSGFMDHWRQIQSGYLKELENTFTELSAVRIPWYPAEVRGMEAVRQFALDLETEFQKKQGQDLFRLPVRTDSEVYEKTPDGYRLLVRIPGGEREDVQAALHGTDLDIRIRNFQRSIPLPGALRGAVIRSCEIADGRLAVEFLAQK